MKQFSAIALLLALLFSACQNKSNTEQTVNDSMTVQGDTILVDTDTVITPKNDSLTAAATPAPKSNAYIIVDKPKLKLYVVEGSDTLFKGPICAARNFGNKQKKDDRRTPEGTFTITKIHDSSAWLYHTPAGRWVPHVYGPWFLRLSADGWDGIGIHGTNAPAQIGQRRSKGCIRMHNEDIQKVHDLAFVGMTVIVKPDNGKVYADSSKPQTKKSDSDNSKSVKSESNSKAAIQDNNQTAPAISEPTKTEPVAEPANEAPVKSEPTEPLPAKVTSPETSAEV